MPAHDEDITKHDKRNHNGQIVGINISFWWLIAFLLIGFSGGVELSHRLYQPIISDYQETVEACRRHLQAEQAPLIIKKPPKKKLIWI